jgi:hypothetical protein
MNTTIRSRIFSVKSLVTIAITCATIANATTTTTAPIQLFNTGIDAGGNLLPNGTVDPHYALVSAPNPFTAAFTGNGSDVQLMPWLQEGPNSRWIGPTAWMGEWRPTGNYTYRTTFDLTGLIPSTATISLNIASDNTANVYLNGVHTGIITSFAGFSSFSNYAISSGFVAGVNTLDFEVYEPGNTPSGLRVEMSGYAAVVPEPGVVAMFSLMGIVFFISQRKTLIQKSC